MLNTIHLVMMKNEELLSKLYSELQILQQNWLQSWQAARVAPLYGCEKWQPGLAAFCEPNAFMQNQNLNNH